jgi:hypothetical protein
LGIFKSRSFQTGGEKTAAYNEDDYLNWMLQIEETLSNNFEN